MDYSLPIATKDRFNLEEEINKAWGVVDDIKTLRFMLDDGIYGVPDMTQDEISCYLLGLETIYDIRFKMLWDCFCQVCKLDDYAEDAAELREALFKKIREKLDDTGDCCSTR